MKTIVVDLDDVLGMFVPVMSEYHNQNYGTNIALQDFYSYKFWEVWKVSQQEAVQRVLEFSRHGGLMNLLPVDGSKRAISHLRQSYTMHIVTARHEEFRGVTQQWIDKHFPGMFSGLHFANHFTEHHRDKGEICEELGAVAVIDDSYENALSCCSSVRQVLLFDAPWNKEKDLPNGMERVYSWDGILKILASE